MKPPNISGLRAGRSTIGAGRARVQTGTNMADVSSITSTISRPSQIEMACAVMAEALTFVHLSWRKNHRNHRLIFGHPSRIVRLDWRRSGGVFFPGQVFAYERWTKGRYGTSQWSLAVLQAVSGSGCISSWPGIRPGADILCSAHGPGPVRACLALIDEVRQSGDPAAISASDWRLIAARHAMRLPVRSAIERAVQRCA